MTFIINGTTLDLQPTVGRWNNRDEIGVDGNGHSVYTGLREFELSWGLMSMSEFQELQNLYDAIGNTGTAVVSLPEYGASAWGFREYSGTVLREPQVGQFFEEHVEDVKLLIVKIRT
jgi:hypothetical protein